MIWTKYKGQGKIMQETKAVRQPKNRHRKKKQTKKRKHTIVVGQKRQTQQYIVR